MRTKPVVLCKKICLKCYFVATRLIDRFFNKPNGYIVHDEAVRVLKAGGYEFQGLAMNILGPQEDSLDLSIIIPIYNSEQYLNKCLESIISQVTDYKYEIVCVNDGSKDSSLKIVEKFQKMNDNIVVLSQINSGISAARNKGIENARGRYLAFVDNDDTISSNFVEICMDLAYKYNADMVQSAYNYVDIKYNKLSTIKKGEFIIRDFSNPLRVTNVKGFIWGGVSKKSLYNNIRFPLGFWYEDMFTRMLLMRKSKIIVSTDVPLYNYLIRSCSASSSLWKNNKIKCVDQLWLPILFTKYGINELELKIDEIHLGVLIKEWSALLYERTKGLSIQERKAIFSLACDFINDINISYYFENTLYRMVDKSFRSHDFRLWNVASSAFKYSI